jgi:hypothetical protein
MKWTPFHFSAPRGQTGKKIKNGRKKEPRGLEKKVERGKRVKKNLKKGERCCVLLLSVSRSVEPPLSWRVFVRGVVCIEICSSR